MTDFNLIEGPWIPCIDLKGNRVEHGIRDTLFKAHELREICDDSPLVTVAIHRLLLAILYRALGGPTGMNQWKALYKNASFLTNGPLTDYLAKWHERFFLFDDAHPFMQVAGLDLNKYNKNGAVKLTKGKNEAMDGIMRLAKEAPDKGGRILFDHRVGTECPEYELKQIVKMILSAQSYAGTGVASQGKINGQTIIPTNCQFAPCMDGVILWLQGKNMFQTLTLNLVPHEVRSSDLPAWEDDNIVTSAINSWSTAVGFTGPVQRFASLSRFIRAIDRKSMFFTNGLKTLADDDDPMKAYSRSSDTEAYKAVKLREDKASWRDAHSLFSLNGSMRKPPASINHAARLARDGLIPMSSSPRANVVGLATDRDKALLWRHDRLPVPLRILGSAALTERLGGPAGLIAEAEGVGAELSKGLFWSATTKKTIRTEPVGRIQTIADLILAPSLELRGAGIVRTLAGRAPDDAHNKSALDLSESLDPRPAYWARLEKHFFALLENLPKDWDEANEDWKPDDQQTATRNWRECVKREAERALEESIRSLGTTARAIQAVSRVRTDFKDGDLNTPLKKEVKAKDKTKGKGGRKK